MGISRTAFSFVLGSVLSLAFGGAPPLRAAAIYFCTTEDGTNPGAIYQTTGGDENYSLVAALPGCGVGAGGNAGPGGSIAINSQGNIFQADAATGDIYEITPSGTVSTFASGIANPGNLAFDGSGDLFVSDAASHAIYEYTPGGVQSTFYAGDDPTYGTGHPLLAGSLAVDASGNVFVVSGSSDCIDEIAHGGGASVFSCAIAAISLALDGSVLFAEGENPGFSGTNFYTYASDGSASLFAATGEDFDEPFTIDGSGDVFYAASQLEIDELPAGGGPSTPFSTRIFPILGPMVVEESSTPEPNSFLLLLAGAGLALLARRRPISTRS